MIKIICTQTKCDMIFCNRIGRYEPTKVVAHCLHCRNTRTFVKINTMLEIYNALGNAHSPLEVGHNSSHVESFSFT